MRSDQPRFFYTYIIYMYYVSYPLFVTNTNTFPTLSQQSRAMPSRVWWKHSRRSDQSDCQALNNDNDGNYNDNDDVNDGNDNCNWYLLMIVIMMIINNDL